MHEVGDRLAVSQQGRYSLAMSCYRKFTARQKSYSLIIIITIITIIIIIIIIIIIFTLLLLLFIIFGTRRAMSEK
jgi:hypothetical protein